MIKNYKLFTESLLDNMKGPTDDEMIIFLKENNPNKLLDIGLQRNNFEFVKTAIENGAEIDYRVNCPLVNFGLSKNWERMKLYMGNNIYLNSNYKSLLKNYARINDTAILKILIVDCDVKTIGDVALAEACHNDCFESAKLLIESGVDVNSYNTYLLRQLVFDEKPNYKIIKLLLDNGANPHINDGFLFNTQDNNILELLNKY